MRSELARSVGEQVGAASAPLAQTGTTEGGLLERMLSSSREEEGASSAPGPRAHDGFARPAARATDPELEGAVVGQFRIVRLLGQGGMGTVYLGEHLMLHRFAAVKTLHPRYAGDREAVARFYREGQLASRINHPNVASIYDLGETPDGLCYLAMEYIEGESLAALLVRQGGRIDPCAAIEIALQTADGIAAAHALGILHRDLKPSNIMIQRAAAGAFVVKVVDFGIARAMDAGEALTRTGLVVGTPDYMSPERLLDGATDGRSDLYSLGCILYQALTGEKPWGDHAGSPQGRLMALPPRPSVRERAIPRSLDDVIVRALAPSPEDRFATAKDMRSALALAGSQLRRAEGAGWWSVRSAVAAEGTLPEGSPRDGARRLREFAAAVRVRGAARARAFPRWMRILRRRGARMVARGGQRALALCGRALRRVASPLRAWVGLAPALRSRSPRAGVIGVAALAVAAAATSALLGHGPEARPVAAPLPPTRAPGAVIQPARARVRLLLTIPLTWRVVVNGQSSAPTPDRVLSLPPGDYRINVLGPGLLSDTFSVQLNAGADTAWLPRLSLETSVPAPGALASPADVAGIDAQIPDTVYLGDPATLLQAIVRDRRNIALAGATLTWRSSDPNVAVVNGTGRLVPVSPGTTYVSVTAGGISRSSLLHVARAPVTRLGALEPRVIAFGDSVQPVTRSFERHGQELTGRAVVRSSGDPDIVDVSGDYLLALGPGTVTITTRAEGVTRRDTVEVVVPTAPARVDGGALKTAARTLFDSLQRDLRGSPGATLERIPMPRALRSELGDLLAAMDPMRREPKVKSGDVRIEGARGSVRFRLQLSRDRAAKGTALDWTDYLADFLWNGDVWRLVAVKRA